MPLRPAPDAVLTVAVTGATGGLGSQFVNIACTRHPEWRIHPLTRAEADMENPEQVIETITRLKPDVVVHAAAMTAVDLCESEPEKAYIVNVAGSAAVAKATREAGARLVYVSTDYVFDGMAGEPYAEVEQIAPLSVYGSTKAAGEMVAQTLTGSLIVRTSGLYGPVGGNFVKTMLTLAQKNVPLRVVNDQVSAPTYTVDCADALVTLVEKGIEGTVHVTNAGRCTWYEFARAIFEEKGLTVDVTPVTSGEYNAPAERPACSLLDVSRYTYISGAPLRDWRDALKEFLKDG